MNAQRIKELSLKGRSYTLKASFSAIAAVERTLDMPIMRALEALGTGQVQMQQLAQVYHGIISANGIKPPPVADIGEALLDMGFADAYLWLGDFMGMALRTNTTQEDPPPGE